MNMKLGRRPAHHRANVSLALGRHAGLSATVKVTSGGLLSIAGLVSTVLLSTAVLVHVAVRSSARSLDP
ncbi:hypothetical protein [Sphingomonas sp. BAUL-RG-20F-R05-02]|uniref:hypothetical protein n=1 Tax=Sphingomonas sp. BAUL-RG-20F-R05-02 TaxID=2914830 RepID=UPI001F5697BD|nr:hypothetical protein [Sphingomonas sp. BAUL-RG-20F-R05-02]